jgi:outer membrane protein
MLRLLSALLLLVALSAAAGAQVATTDTLAQSAVPRVGFVDIERVLERSAAVRRIMAELDAELARESSAIDAKKAEARRIGLQLEQQNAVLSDAERATRRQRALDLIAEADEMEFKFNRRVRETQRSTVAPLLEQVIVFIGDVADRRGFDLVVRGEMVLYGRSTVDLTPDTIRELDSRFEELRAAAMKERAPAAGAEPTPGQPALLPLVP